MCVPLRPSLFTEVYLLERDSQISDLTEGVLQQKHAILLQSRKEFQSVCALLRLSLFTDFSSQTLDQAVGVLQLKHTSLLQDSKKFYSSDP